DTLVNRRSQVGILHGWVKDEMPQFAEEAYFLVSRAGDGCPKLHQIVARPRLGLRQTAVKEVHRFVSYLLQGLLDKSQPERVPAVGRHALEGLIGGPARNLG